MQADQNSSPGDTGVVASYSYAARYCYSDVVVQNDNLLRLSAAADPYQTPLAGSVATRPFSQLARFRDGYGNLTCQGRIATPHRRLTVLAIGVVLLHRLPASIPEVPLAQLQPAVKGSEFLKPTPLVDQERLLEATMSVIQGAKGLLEAVRLVNDWIYGNIAYVKESTSVATTAEQAFGARQGVCQDMAHLSIGMLKAAGIPARYVSGLLASEVGETHAWVEFLHPLLGWLPSDPSRGQALAMQRDLVKFAVARDYTQATPVEGHFVSEGSGWLEVALARVYPGRDSVSFEDALSLLDEAR